MSDDITLACSVCGESVVVAGVPDGWSYDTGADGKCPAHREEPITPTMVQAGVDLIHANRPHGWFPRRTDMSTPELATRIYVAMRARTPDKIGG